MRSRKQFLSRLFLAGIVGLFLLGGCGTGEVQASGKQDTAEEGQAGQETDPDTKQEQSEGAAPEPGQAEGAAPEPGQAERDQIGEFSMEDIQGEVYTQEMFAAHKLTMVNVFATWCGPCVREIPDLEKLNNEMSGQGIQVVGIVLDAIDQYGEKDPEAVEKAGILAEQLEVTYPFLIPDEGYLGGRLLGIEAVPTTFFVDEEGHIVGEAYLGSRSLEDWKSIVEEKLGEAGQ